MPALTYAQEFISSDSLALFGILIGIMLALSPVPTFIDIAIHSKTTGGYTVAPYIASLLCCSLWLMYAFVAGASKYDLIPLNLMSFVIYSIYCSIFAYYCPNLYYVLQIYMLGASILGLTLLIALVTQSLVFIGILATIANTLMFAAPLAVMRSVIETESVRYMPFMLSFSSFLCATIWLMWALVVDDYFVLVPNALGTIFGLIQLALYSMYFRSVGEDIVIMVDSGTPTECITRAVEPFNTTQY